MAEIHLSLPDGPIEVNPNKCRGKPVLKGTRFTLAQLFVELAEGRSSRELANDFDLDLGTIQEVLRCLSVASDTGWSEFVP